MTRKSVIGLIALPTFIARLQMPARRGARGAEPASVPATVTIAPLGSVSRRIGAPSAEICARSRPLSPRSGTNALSTASVRYAVDVALGSVIEAAIADAAGATAVLSPPQFADVGRAVAMDHDQPIAMSSTNTLDSTLNARSLRVESPARWYQRDGRGGTRIAQSDILRRFAQDPSRLSLFSGSVHRMDWFRELYHLLSDLPTLIKWGGYVGLTTIVFTETGLLVGFFLPGDSLLVTAGLLASQGFLNVYVMGALLTVAAIAGDSVGYSIGRAAGPRLFRREDSFFFNKKHLYRAHDFYLRHGGKTIVIARFVPILRTFAPVVAGAADMPYRRFIFFNIAGGIGWIWSMLMVGYVLGRYIPGIEKRIEWVIVAVIGLSLVPILVEYLKSRKKNVTSD